MNTLLAQFVSEAADLLDQLDGGLLTLERNPHDGGALDEVFRAVHTLKGSSGLFDLPALTRLTHAAEDLLDGVRAGRLALDAALADDLLAAVDLIREWLPALQDDQPLPPGATRAAEDLGRRLRAPLSGTGSRPEADAGTAGPASVALPGGRLGSQAPTWLPEALPPAELERVRDWLRAARTSCRVLRFVPAERCFYSGHDPLHLVSQIPAVEALAASPRRPWPSLDAFDEYTCLLEFVVVTRASEAELEHLFRYVLDEVEVAEVDDVSLSAVLDAANPLPDAQPAAPRRASSPAGAAARALLTGQLHALREAEALPAGTPELAGRIASVTAVVRGALAAVGRAGPELDDIAACAPSAGPGPLRALIEASLADLDGGGPPSAAPADRRAASRTLKVDHDTVDRLLDLVGQLVVATNALPLLAGAAEQGAGGRGLGRRIKEQYGLLHRIGEELQTTVMDVRTVPVSVAFARVPRLVRDLARTLGKQVDLELEGEDTAADKDVIDALADPIVHLVRNGMDHGVEPPAARLAAGKPQRATIRLRAVHEPDAVVVEVIDDGRGIDPDVVRRRAVERGLITPERAASIADADALDLVLLPGFSTADRVSDVSGRGVGLDAVRAAVHAAGGTVRLAGVPGEGTRVELRMPLSMAVSTVMLVDVDGQPFGVPVEQVLENVRVPRERVTRVGRGEAVVVRDRIVPLVDLAKQLRMAGAVPAPKAAGEFDVAGENCSGRYGDLVSVIVTRQGPQDVGLVVDGFRSGAAEVIVRPLEGIVAGARHYVGTALMPDGSVLLVLDVAEVIAGAGTPG